MLNRIGKVRKDVAEKKKTKKVNFSMIAPDAEEVLLVGDFNDWEENPHLLKKDKKGTWKTSIKLEPGRYEYRFLVDGEWQNGSNCSTFVSNPYGGENCVITLKNE